MANIDGCEHIKKWPFDQGYSYILLKSNKNFLEALSEHLVL